jgi:type I restriction enzyme S subunit
MKPYPTYKPAAVPWLQQVPEHWEMQRIKTLVREMESRSKEGKEVLMSLSKSKGLVPQSDLGGKAPSAKTHVGYKICEPEQIVMNRMQAWNGLFGLAKQRGMVSPDYAVFKVLGEQQPYFLQQLFRCPLVVEQFANASKGIGTGFNRLYTDKFGAIAVPVAPPEEQHLIVRYLHALDAKVKRYIRTKRTLIARLQEQKQAIIQRAVTRGLDPNVKLKPSGSIWLGEIPEKWTGLPLKRWLVTPITDGPHETPVLHDSGVPFMSAESMVNGRLDFDRKRGFIAQADHETYCLKLRPRRDDIFMCKSGATTGKVAIVETDEEFSVWSPLALVRVDRKKVISRLLFQMLQTPYVQRQVQMTWSAGTQPNLSMSAMARLFIALPSLAEQEQILDFIKSETGPIDLTIARVHKEIDFMLEYHTRLIADVVTGAVDVTAAAKALAVDAEGLMEPAFAEDAVGEEEPFEPELNEEAE